jgi:hypothetical protein
MLIRAQRPSTTIDARTSIAMPHTSGRIRRRRLKY